MTPGLTSTQGQEPIADGEHTSAVLASFLASLDLDQVVTVYVSTPVTTGRAFYRQWRSLATGDPHLADQKILAMARQRAMAENRRLSDDMTRRAKLKGLGTCYINPTHLDVPDWTQEQYLNFWIKFITRYVEKIVMTSGWEYSTGCVSEYLTAVKLGIPTMDSAFRLLSPVEAARKIDEALADILQLGINPVHLSALSTELKHLIRQGED